MEHPPEIQAVIAKYPTLKKAFDTGVESDDGREGALLEFILAHPSRIQFKTAPQTLLDAVDEFSFKKDFLISVGPHKAGVLSDLLEKHKPTSIIELGSYLGYSAILFAHTMKTNTQNAGGEVKDLKIWSLEMNVEFAGIARQLIDLAGFDDIIEVVIGPAEDSLRQLVKDGTITNVDMVFLDHVEELYVQDFKVCQELGLLKKGTMVVADNVLRPGAPDYRALVRGLKGVKSEGIIGLIIPGGAEDELEVSNVLEDLKSGKDDTSTT
ncbi:S-adenosyl-L-methionine-dependent methyltransferase [Mollisia scopiformis]|uniref:catechol O-methyltransferase n=1 Tax=Mollisia scopiformis TaxID=149040 RepID=A0A194XBS8_MOLSC|nr:S-adenosyl-L-methionine-dependent methyltransferase [Mollisia scopiformis]KUJ17620.1 S-adenosyl-L-methionine-dependent methyltransferase [Mollisia scopiformis]